MNSFNEKAIGSSFYLSCPLTNENLDIAIKLCDLARRFYYGKSKRKAKTN
jgi:hypothetical protein